MALSNVQEVVERSIYEAIRLVLVDEGYTPDIDLFPNTAQGQQDFLTAQQAVKTSKGFVIELFGTSGLHTKGSLKTPRMVIMTRRILPGEIGNAPDILYQAIDEEITAYEGQKLPPTTSEVQVEIILVSKKQAEDRIMHAVLGRALTTRKYIPVYNDDSQAMLVTHVGSNDFFELSEGISERRYTYQVSDIYTSEPQVVEENVAPINEITLETQNDDGTGNFVETDIIT